MAKWNPTKMLLDHDVKRELSFRLMDVENPKLMRDIFPYTEISKITFDHRYEMPSPCEDMFITDTTFRDGQQARPPFSVEQISKIFGFLHKMGGPKGIIRASEFFLYTEKDREAVRACQSKGYEFPKITGWVRANKKDLAIVKEMNLDETGILTSVSDYHIFLKLNKSRSQAMEDYLNIVKSAIEIGVKPRCHFEDITRADIYGFCVPFAIELMKLSEESGINIKIRLCDTMGYGITYPGAALPRSVPKLVRAFIQDAGVPGNLLEWHGHNDFHKVVINATTAWLFGCNAINGTLLGFGERTGNTPIEALLIERISLRGTTDGIDTMAITEMANYFQEEIGYHIPRNYPLVGADFNATSAGIHVDGLLKNEEIYNVFDTGKILGRPPSVIISDKSGTAGIAHWVNKFLELKDDEILDKRHPSIVKIYKKVMVEYDNGRVTSMSTGEMELLCRRYLPQYFTSEFDELKEKAKYHTFELISGLLEQNEIKSMNSVNIEPILKKVIEDYPYIQFIYVINMEGKKITENVTHIEDKAKFSQITQNQDFSDRKWFIEPVEDGKIHITDFYTSRITNQLCLTVSGPVRDTSEEIVGVLGMDIKIESLARMEHEEEE
jgi:isopropylmalate/homocitrate/citramalate synthase